MQYSIYVISIYMICGRIYDECYCWQFTVLSDGPAQFLERSRITLPSYPMLLPAHYLDRFRCFDDFPVESYPRFTPPASSHTRTGDRPVYVYTHKTHLPTHKMAVYFSSVYLYLQTARWAMKVAYTHQPYSTIHTFGRFGCTSESGLVRDRKKRRKSKKIYFIRQKLKRPRNKSLANFFPREE